MFFTALSYRLPSTTTAVMVRHDSTSFKTTTRKVLVRASLALGLFLDEEKYELHPAPWGRHSAYKKQKNKKRRKLTGDERAGPNARLQCKACPGLGRRGGGGGEYSLVRYLRRAGNIQEIHQIAKKKKKKIILVRTTATTGTVIAPGPGKKRGIPARLPVRPCWRCETLQKLGTSPSTPTTPRHDTTRAGRHQNAHARRKKAIKNKTKTPRTRQRPTQLVAAFTQIFIY